MSVGPLPPAGNLAGTPQAQSAGTDSHMRKEGADQARQSASAQRADDASGIGKTEEDSQAEERDADGRMAWQRPRAQARSPEEESTEDRPDTPRSADPEGVRGNEIDFSA